MSSQPAPVRVVLWTRGRWAFIASLLALMTFIAFEAFAITTLLPVAMRELGAASWYSLAYSATITTALIGMIVGGNWADRRGPRTPLVVGGILFVFGIALCAMSPDALIFTLGRLLQGLGGGIDSVVLYVLIAQFIPEGPRPRMFGLLTAAWLLPSIAGPLLTGTLTEMVSWRVVFVVIFIGSSIALICLLRATRVPVDASKPSDSDSPLFGRKGAFAVLAAALLVLLHLAGQRSSALSLFLVVSAAIGVLLATRELMPAGTLRLRGTAQKLIALRCVLGSICTASDIYLTLFLQNTRGLPPSAAGLVIAVGALGWALGAWIQGRFDSSGANHRQLIAVSTPFVVSAPACVLLYVLELAPITLVVASCIAMGAGMGLAYPRISTATLGLAAESERGNYSSALQAGESIAIAITTAIMSAVLAATAESQSGFIAIYMTLTGVGLTAVLVTIRGSSLSMSRRSLRMGQVRSRGIR